MQGSSEDSLPDNLNAVSSMGCGLEHWEQLVGGFSALPRLGDAGLLEELPSKWSPGLWTEMSGEGEGRVC